MPLSLNEIKKRAVAFSKEWENETSEDAEAKSFWDGFFNIFGIPRRRVATFEEHVKKIDHKQGFIDLLWKGKLLIEHKSKGRDLDKAYKQAKDYFPGLTDAELPQYILVCDFDRFRLYNLDDNTQHDFHLKKLAENIRLFDFISGHTQHKVREQDPINMKAAEKMGLLHDKLKAVGYEGHELELYLVRLVFCLFADDTGIFEPGIFYDMLDQRTKEDGSDLAGWMAQLFDVLNKDPEKRFKNLDENLAAFPYINGKLFEEPLPTASFDSDMRRILIDCCALNWSAISPAIFGSLFQSVMDEKARRNLGAHYTSEQNILKLIKPLFLDDLYTEFNKVKGNSRQLDEFHIKLSKLRFLDPACGCGNFLIVAYRELRMLEIEVIKAKFKNQMATNIEAYVNINVDQFYGIEYEEFPAQIAQVAMWLMDHQMNQQVSEAFGNYFVRIPLRKSATIVHGNALRTDWQSLIVEEGVCYDYIIGNPPFLGTAYQTAEQKNDMSIIFHQVESSGMLDYVTAWYKKASEYLRSYNNKDRNIKVAFVSTNSIIQGEQTGILWSVLFQQYNLKILFAHRTFKWSNEAKGNAGVHVVIIGFSDIDSPKKTIYEYEDLKAEPLKREVKNINPYLVEGQDTVLKSISKPICAVPRMQSGSAARDGGFLIFSDESKKAVEAIYPTSTKYFRRFISGDDIINSIVRWCIWLKGVNPSEVKGIGDFTEAFKNVRKFREQSTRAGTKKWRTFHICLQKKGNQRKTF
jgi:hypothetical protein